MELQRREKLLKEREEMIELKEISGNQTIPLQSQMNQSKQMKQTQNIQNIQNNQNIQSKTKNIQAF